jgi:hypothetical protein
VIINPIYEFLPQSINVTSSGGLEDIRSTM